MFAWNQFSTSAAQNEEGQDKSNDESYSGIDHNMQKVAVVFWRMSVCSRIAWLGHLILDAI